MKPSAFEYHAPATVGQAVTLLAELHAAGAEVKVLAGGQSLIPVLAMRLSAFDHLIDIGRIAELKGTTREQNTVTVGAATTQAAAGADPAVVKDVPLLARAVPLIAHFQIRNRGTVGGSVAHADPSAESPAVTLALDAEIEATSVRGIRKIPARDFFLGVWSTALEPDELLTRIRFPVRTQNSGFAIQEIARRHGDFAVAGAAVAVRLDGPGNVRSGAIAFFGLDLTPVRARVTEASLAGRPAAGLDPDEVAAAAVAELANVPSDLHGTADYRRKTGAVVAARALSAALSEAQGKSS
jgi:carbon-monoxide dehydrogenase medium subunit